jgi:hypothetical protein
MAANWAIDAKRTVILAAEAKIDHFAQLMQEKPRLARLYEYWMRWYIVRRADWTTRAYLEQVRGWKRQIQAWERDESLDQHLNECGIIAKNCDTIEEGLQVITTELKQTLDLARERNWKIRYPKPQTTMEGWISTIHNRYPIIKEWIKRIRDELPAEWVSIVYVIYYSYVGVGTGKLRHIEAHFESLAVNDKAVLLKVKEMANKVLRAFVSAPRVVAGEIAKDYSVPLLRMPLEGGPLLRPEMGTPPYEGKKGRKDNGHYWEWGLQVNREVNYVVRDSRVSPAEPIRKQFKKTVPIRMEIFDFDFASIRSYLDKDAPAKWWEMTLTELLEFLGIEVER